MNANTSFGPQGQSITTTSGGDLPNTPALPTAGKVDPAFIAFLQSLVKKRSAAPMMGAGGSSHAGTVGYAPVKPAFDPNAGLKQEAEAQQLQAAINPEPLRATSFASNAINGYTPDTQRMTGIQRQMFLPQDSKQIGVPFAFADKGMPVQSTNKVEF